jgi:MSHA biogenesis protein MshM
MYESYFGLERPPFQITPDPSLFFEGGKRGAVLDALVYAIERGEGIVKVVGEVGSGKTMICRMLELRVSSNTEIIYIANPNLGPDDILRVIADELDLSLDAGAGKHEVMRALQTHLVDLHAGGKQMVIFVEEAQGMPLETLEEIRLLSNLETGRNKLLQIVLFGQPELDENLALRSIRQLRERISHSFELLPLASDEICTYLNFRMRQVGYRGPDLITPKVARAIARHSDGLIRRVNILADKTLLAAYSANTHSVMVRHVRDAARDSAFPKFRHARPREAPRWLLLGGAATFGLAVAMVGGWTYLTLTGPSPRAALASVEIGVAAPSTPVPPGGAESPSSASPPPPPEAATSAAVAAPLTPAAPAASSGNTEAVEDDRAAAGDVDQVTLADAETDLREPPARLRTQDLVDLGAGGRPESLTAEGRQWLEDEVHRAREWMAQSGPDRITIQVMMREKAAAHDLVWFLNEAWPLDLEHTYIDEVASKRNPVYRVFYGDFEDWKTGRGELARLPSSILTSQPYLRRIPLVPAVVSAGDGGSTIRRQTLAERAE